MNLAETLQAARREVERGRDHTMSVASDLEGTLTAVQDNWNGEAHCLQHCMVEAMQRESGLRGHAYPEDWMARVGAMVRSMDYTHPVAMYNWNDTPGRTKDEVIHRVKDALNNL